jgi:hypothetical protein
MDVTLSGGKVLTVDLRRITIREYRELVTTKDQPREDALIAQVVGLTADELLDLPQPDYRLVVDRFFKTATEPLADPTSASASISP